MTILDKPEYSELKEFLEKFENSEDTLYWYAYNTNQIFKHLRTMIKNGIIDDVKEIDTRHVNPILIKVMKKFEKKGEHKLFLKEVGTIYQGISAPPGGKFWEVEVFQSISIAASRIERLNQTFSWFSFENIRVQLEDIKSNDNIQLHRDFINYLVDMSLKELNSYESFKHGINDLRKLKGPEGRASKLRQTTAIQGFEHRAQGYFLLMRTAVRLFKTSEVTKLIEEISDIIYETGSTGFGTPSSEWLLCAFDLGYEYLNRDWTSNVYIAARITIEHSYLKMNDMLNMVSKGRRAVWQFQKTNPEAGLKLENYLNNSKCGFKSKFDTELMTLVQDADIILRQEKSSKLLLNIESSLLELFKNADSLSNDEYCYAKRVVSVVLIRCAFLKNMPNIRTYTLLNEQFSKEKSLENNYGKVVTVKRETPVDKRSSAPYGKWLQSRINNESLSDLEYMTAMYANELFLRE